MQFYLLRKYGLLAHTLPTFLKNCCTEKLFILCFVTAKLIVFIYGNALFLNEKSPLLFLPDFPSISNTNPFRCLNLRTKSIVCNPQIRASQKVITIPLLIHLQVFRQLRRAIMHNPCTKQHALRLLWFASNHIHQPMHPITQIHINQTAFPIKQLCSFGSAFVSMASLIFFSPIGFCFCNAFLQNRSIRQLPNQQLPHQIRCNFQTIPMKKICSQSFHHKVSSSSKVCRGVTYSVL